MYKYITMETAKQTKDSKWQAHKREIVLFAHIPKSDFETGKGCVFNEQNLPVSKTHSLVIKPQEVNFK